MTLSLPARQTEAFSEFGLRSNFSFLEGASHPEELAVTIARLGQRRFGLADRNTVAGVVRAHVAARESGLVLHPGARLCFSDGTPDILAYPKTRTGWGRLCRLLTRGNLRAEKGVCTLYLQDLLDWGEELNLIVLPGTGPALGDPESGDEQEENLRNLLRHLKSAFGRAVRLALIPLHDGHDRIRLARLARIASAVRVKTIASNDALCHDPARRADQHVLTAIRNHVPLDRAGRLLSAHGERHLKSTGEMNYLLRDYPGALTETARFAGELSFSLDELRYQYPDEKLGEGTPQDHLARLAHEGARTRYPDGVPERVERQIAHELALIAELDYAPYFLTVWDIVRFARSQDILCQGRGSAANSTICYCLGITEVDPIFADLLFERFISPERREPPDIDVDFEHERREEVIQYIYERYGRDHAGLAATVICYRARSASREVGKAFGLSEDAISALSGSIWSSEAMGEREAKIAGLDTADRTTRQVLDHAARLAGFPRHLSQHVGGFVITRDRLDEVVPLMNTAMEGRTMVEWDKDDLDALGILKIDILALGMLTCLARGLKLLASHYEEPLTLATIPKERPYVYDMIQRADTIGVFQIESRAQMSMLPRLKPENFYDLVIEVAIVRPGPIQGDMVHPYLRRREGKEPVTYPKEELRAVLGKTLGIPLFQEQAMKIAIVAASFTPSEADRLRRAMATFRRVGTIHTFQKKMIDGMVGNGYEKQFAERCFQQIEGFGEYGFPESHAASFALLVYASSWMKALYPDVFCAAILNAQPMGFSAPGQLIRDAREHGVEIRPVDINLSDWDCTLEEEPFDPARIAPRHAGMRDVIRTRNAVRLGFRQVKGLSEADMTRLVEMRGAGYDSVRDLWLRAGLARATIERLADADAFASLGLSRRAALWAARALDPAAASEHLPLFESAAGPSPETEAGMRLPAMPPGEEVINDYRYLSFSLKAHPLSFLRDRLARQGIVPNQHLETLRTGRRATLAGLVLVRQRPGSAKGVIFMTIEDETGIANIIVWPKAFERFRGEVLGARLIRVEGRLQNESGVIHLIADRIADMSHELAWLDADHDPKAADIESLARGDEVRRPVMENRTFRKSGALATRKLKAASMAPAADVAAGKQSPTPLSGPAREAVEVMPKGRNFH